MKKTTKITIASLALITTFLSSTITLSAMDLSHSINQKSSFKRKYTRVKQQKWSEQEISTFKGYLNSHTQEFHGVNWAMLQNLLPNKTILNIKTYYKEYIKDKEHEQHQDDIPWTEDDIKQLTEYVNTHQAPNNRVNWDEIELVFPDRDILKVIIYYHFHLKNKQIDKTQIPETYETDHKHKTNDEKETDLPDLDRYLFDCFYQYKTVLSDSPSIL